ncbi:hypothetical protein [Demequina litorisediminis]|uniref:Core-binding (CB) domain-containing protein n=1 Tax=Demequina litorisediminis TaxID=1849022 RepID=A0ABQ6IK60_9MICO|nr:hypothetical protein [Demequina litorisediminis]GMA37547.1 hypothetical protein GCM10025876_37510 [Demequina litorisediminis]
MTRARLTIGTFGGITYLEAPRGRVVARTRYRDWDGKNWLVQANANTRSQAEQALKAKARRSEPVPARQARSCHPTAPSRTGSRIGPRMSSLRRGSRSALWSLYVRDMRTLVLPVFEGLTLRDIGVARCDQYLKVLAKQSLQPRARAVLRLALELAVRHEVMPRNPMAHVSPLRRPASRPNALTATEVNAVRAVIASWAMGGSYTGPPPDGHSERSSRSCSAPPPASARPWLSGAAMST